MSKKTVVFKDFKDYWHFVKHLTQKNRKTIFNSLSQDQQKMLKKSYEIGGWQDVFVRNRINEIIDEVKEKHGYSLLEIKSKIISGKSVYLPTDIWDEIESNFEKFPEKDIQFVLGGIMSCRCKENTKVTLLTKI